jgi:hypothetical protein
MPSIKKAPVNLTMAQCQQVLESLASRISREESRLRQHKAGIATSVDALHPKELKACHSASKQVQLSINRHFRVMERDRKQTLPPLSRSERW